MIAGEDAVLIIVTGREGHDLFAEFREHFGLGSEYDRTGFVVSVVERTDADRIPGCYEGVSLPIIEDQCEFRVESREHFAAQPFIEGQEDLTVAVALKLISEGDQPALYRAETVQLAVADAGVPVQNKGLHAFGRQAHDRKAVESEKTVSCREDPGHVRSA